MSNSHKKIMNEYGIVKCRKNDKLNSTNSNSTALQFYPFNNKCFP